MLKKSSILFRLEYIYAHMNGEEKDFTLKTNFIDDLGFDSLDCVEFIMLAENEYNISISDKEVESIWTIGALIDIISEKVSVGVEDDLKHIVRVSRIYEFSEKDIKDYIKYQPEIINKPKDEILKLLAKNLFNGEYEFIDPKDEAYFTYTIHPC